MTQSLAVRDTASIMERAVIQGDLSELSPEERTAYYRGTCESLGLNPYTKPFEYLLLDNGSGGKKLVLYARKDCTDQLRDIKRVSITKLERERTQDLYVVTAHAILPDGRTDSAVGAVPIAKEGGYWEDVTDQHGRPVVSAGKPKRRFVSDGRYVSLTGDALANAIMKAETKAKRRVTLSICGLGFSDESEVDSIPGSTIVEAEYPSPPAAPSPVMVSSADSRVWKRWLEIKGEAEGLGVRVPELRLPVALDELTQHANAIQLVIAARKDQLAEQETAAAAGKAAHDTATNGLGQTVDTQSGEVLDEKGGDDADRAGVEGSAGAAPKASKTQEIQDRRSALWQENRRLVARAQELGVQGDTLNTRSGEDVIADANRVRDERIKNVELDRQLAAEQDKQVGF